MAFIKDPATTLADAISGQSQSIASELRNSATASGLQALDNLTGRRRVGPPKITTRTSHSVTLRSGGFFIGGINSFSQNQGRDVKENFYLAPIPSGEPSEIIPKNVTSRKLTIASYDLYRTPFEERFGDFDLLRLTNQKNAFEIVERIQDPFNNVKVIVYEGCYFSSLGYEYRAQDDMVVMYDAELIFLTKTKS